MKLDIKNIGNIKDAEISLKGITVLAGHNGTGKSTVSKTLFSVFNSLHNYNQKIKDDKAYEMKKVLERFLMNLDISNFSVLLDFIEDSNGRFKTEFKSVTSFDDIYDIVQDIAKQISKNVNKNDIDDICNKINSIFNQSDEAVLNQIISSAFNEEFNNQINNIYDDSIGSIGLDVRDDYLNFVVKNNQINLDGKPISFYMDVAYIDDAAANVWRYYNREKEFSRKRENYDMYNRIDNHNNHLQYQLVESSQLDNSARKALIDSKLYNIFEMINSTLGNNAPNDKYKREEENKINIVNYSSGMQTFYIIKKLLESGILEDNGILILDEPEVHLHPEWQLKFSEIAVLLHKVLGMHILINTHSPYMLNALEVYSEKYCISKECEFYLSTLDDGGYASFEKVNNTEKIYDILAEPFQTLENLEDTLESLSEKGDVN